VRRPHRTRHALSRAGILLALGGLAFVSCDDGEPAGSEFVDVPGVEGRLKSSPAVRLARRAFDGAPPVIPHEPRADSCLSCHDEVGLEVPDLGFAPPMPHALTEGLSSIARCVQCHVYRTTDGEFVASEYVAYRAPDEPHTAFDGAPAVLPHRVFMREACASCHSGPAAREDIRTDHPERANCTQCHVEVETVAEFTR
jgi:cytochrome c-type protein NapB